MEKSFLLNYPTLGKELQRLQSKSGKFYDTYIIIPFTPSRDQDILSPYN